MKRWLSSYMSFTRTERLGLVGLCVLLLVLILIRFTMHLWVKPRTNAVMERQMLAAWQHIEGSEQAKEQEYMASATGAEGTTDTTLQITGDLFPFDPNTLDSAGFRRLGLREKTTSNLLHWRAKGKRFYKKEDLKPLYTLTDAEYNRLAPYISIHLPRVDLNTADSMDLVALKGIGPRIAHRILDYRREKGKFTSYDQLLEVYSFPQSTFLMLKQQLIIK